MRKTLEFLFAAVVAIQLGTRTVLAHGLGDRYEVSLPAVLFYVGGVGVVVVSFVLVSVFAGTERGSHSYRSKSLRRTPLSVLTSDPIVSFARIGSVALLVVGLLSGFFGPEGFEENLLVNLVWVGWWVGYTFSVIFIANTWPTLNPWKVSYEWATMALGRDPSLEREYRFGSIPVVVLFLAFAWLEIISPWSEEPTMLAIIILGYSLYLWSGMFVYGGETWLYWADPFTRLFDYLGKFAPLTADNGGEVRMYGVGLVPEEPSLHTLGGLGFVIAVLYSVTFDGFLPTPEWRAIATAAPEIGIPYLTSAILMLLGFALFVAIYLGFSSLIELAGGVDVGTISIARRFALSLLPIAIAYQVAHFWTFLLTQGQFFVLTLMDPFGRGWALPGLAGYEPTSELPFLTVEGVWQSQVAIILLGHVIAVWVAHHIALDVYDTRRQAIWSQLPMMVLMVGYTMLSLWILSRPILNPVLP